MCEVGRPSARVVLQKCKESNDGHTLELRYMSLGGFYAELISHQSVSSARAEYATLAGQ